MKHDGKCMIISDIVWYFQILVHEWRFCSTEGHNQTLLKENKNLSFSALFSLYWTQLCSYWCESGSSSVKSKEKSIQSVWPSDSPPPSAHGELLLIRPDHGPRAYPHTARDTSSLKGAAGPQEWRKRDPTGEGGIRQWPAQASLNHLSDLRNCQLPCKKLCRLNLTKHPV